MSILQRSQAVLLTTATALFLVACTKADNTTVGEQVDNAIDKSKSVASDVKQEVREATADAKQGGAAVVDSVAVGAADLSITAKVKTALAADAELSAVGINVDTVNSVVSLSGPAPTLVAADRATTLAKAVEGVTSVKNMLTVDNKS